MKMMGSINKIALINAASKLIRVDQIDIGLVASNIAAKTIGPIFTENKIPLLVFWDANQDIIDLGEYVVSSGFVTELAGEEMANFVHERLSVNKIYIVSDMGEWGEIISTAFIDKFTSLKGEVVAYKKVNTDVTATAK